jgi:hypothetical protein
MSEKLKPCPLCGGKANWEYKDWDMESETGDDGTGWIRCHDCTLVLFGGFREEAEVQWNKRKNILPIQIGGF